MTSVAATARRASAPARLLPMGGRRLATQEVEQQLAEGLRLLERGEVPGARDGDAAGVRQLGGPGVGARVEVRHVVLPDGDQRGEIAELAALQGVRRLLRLAGRQLGLERAAL